MLFQVQDEEAQQRDVVNHPARDVDEDDDEGDDASQDGVEQTSEA